MVTAAAHEVHTGGALSAAPGRHFVFSSMVVPADAGPHRSEPDR